jgi:hypothetical protein
MTIGGAGRGRVNSIVLAPGCDRHKTEASFILAEDFAGDFLWVWGLNDNTFWRSTNVAKEGSQTETEYDTNN